MHSYGHVNLITIHSSKLVSLTRFRYHMRHRHHYWLADRRHSRRCCHRFRILTSLDNWLLVAFSLLYLIMRRVDILIILKSINIEFNIFLLKCHLIIFELVFLRKLLPLCSYYFYQLLRFKARVEFLYLFVHFLHKHLVASYLFVLTFFWFFFLRWY